MSEINFLKTKKKLQKKKILHQKKKKKKKILIKKKLFSSRTLEVEGKKMRLIVKIAMSKNQNQMKKNVETQNLKLMMKVKLSL